jgi:hypothetical protein
VVDRKKGKKGEKKVSTFCISKKVRLEGSPKVAPYFQLWNKRALSNDCLLVQNIHATFWRRSKKKGKVVTTGIKAVSWYDFTYRQKIVPQIVPQIWY